MENEQIELLKITTSFLGENNIPYMITGAWSVIYYGRPRASHDVDFIIEVETEEISQTLKSFKKLPEDFLIQVREIKEAIKKKSQFNILHLPTGLKLDFWLLTDDPFDKSRFSRRKKLEILGQLMWMATPEDTILQKLRWYKEAKIEKHLVDAAFVYQIQKKNLDMKYLGNWVKELDVERYFKELDKIDLEEYF